MPSPFAHLAVGFSIGLVGARALKLPAKRFVAAAMFAALAPDLDIIALAFGIDHHSVYGHRGALHSILAAVAIAWAAFGLAGLPAGARARRGAFLAMLVAALSHGLLDAFTAGEYGVASLWPMSDARWLSSFHPLLDPPDDPGWYIHPVALRIFGVELLEIELPCLLAIGAVAWMQQKTLRAPAARSADGG